MKSKVELLDKTKKKKIISLVEKYGIEKLPQLLIKTGKDNYRIYSGSLSKEELNILAKKVKVELIGAKFGKKVDENLRLNFDILNLKEIKSQLNTGIEISDKQVKEWMKGDNIEIETKSKEKYSIVKNKNDLLGMGLNQKNHLKNYVPKERRLR